MFVRIFVLDYRLEKSLTNILTKNTLEYLAFGEYFWRDRAVALEPTEQREQRERLAFHYAESRRRKTNVTSELKSELKS